MRAHVWQSRICITPIKEFIHYKDCQAEDEGEIGNVLLKSKCMQMENSLGLAVLMLKWQRKFHETVFMFSTTNPLTYHKAPDGTDGHICFLTSDKEQNPAEQWQNLHPHHFDPRNCLHCDRLNHHYWIVITYQHHRLDTEGIFCPYFQRQDARFRISSFRALGIPPT